MREFLNLRASETMDQQELVAFLKQRFPDQTRLINRVLVPGTESVETRVPTNSKEFLEIKDFVNSAEEEAYQFVLTWLLRKYNKTELEMAEALLLNIGSYFEPCGEECGTVYDNARACQFCNAAQLLSDLVLDPRSIPSGKDIAITIAQTEWIVSRRFKSRFTQQGLTGAEFLPIYDFSHPNRKLEKWFQLVVKGQAGKLASETRLGQDAFSPDTGIWRCPNGHSMLAQFLSEVHLNRENWDGSDIAITSCLIGQGRNLVRPCPLVIISQRLYQLLLALGTKGFSVEVIHFV